MMRRQLNLMALVACLAAFVPATAAPAHAAAITLSAPSVVEVGDSFDLLVNLALEADENVVAFEFELTFDHVLLASGAPALGPAAAGVGTWFEFADDSTPGSLVYSAGLDPPDLLTGSLLLFEVPFTALATGTATMTLGPSPLDVLFTLVGEDQTTFGLLPIQVTLPQSAGVEIVQPVPEPATLWLVGSGAAFIAFRARPRRR